MPDVADRWSDLRWRVRGWLWTLRHPYRRWGPRCAAEPPWRLPDAGTCACWRGHEHHGGPSPDWHWDGNGYIWNATRWAWRGPTVDLAEVLRDHPARDTTGDVYVATFTETGEPDA